MCNNEASPPVAADVVAIEGDGNAVGPLCHNPADIAGRNGAGNHLALAVLKATL